MSDDNFTDTVTVQIDEQPQSGHFIIEAKSERTGETWYCITRTLAHAGAALSAASIGEVTECWDGTGGPFVVTHSITDAMQAFKRAEDLWSLSVRSKDNDDRRFYMELAQSAANFS